MAATKGAKLLKDTLDSMSEMITTGNQKYIEVMQAAHKIEETNSMTINNFTSTVFLHWLTVKTLKYYHVKVIGFPTVDPICKAQFIDAMKRSK